MIEQIGFYSSGSLTSGSVNINNQPTYSIILVYDDDTKNVDLTWEIEWQDELYLLTKNPTPRYIARRQYIVLQVRLKGDKNIPFNQI